MFCITALKPISTSVIIKLFCFHLFPECHHLSTIVLPQSVRHWDTPYSIITPLFICPPCMCTVNLCFLSVSQSSQSGNLPTRSGFLWTPPLSGHNTQLVNNNMYIETVIQQSACCEQATREGSLSLQTWVGNNIKTSGRKWGQIYSMWQKMSNHSWGSDKNHHVNNFRQQKGGDVRLRKEG